MPDVFISYPKQEKEKAELLARAFQSRGLNAWLAHKDLTPEGSARDQILDNLNSCKAVVLLVEPTLKLSSGLQFEYMTALESAWKDEDKLLVAVLTGKGEPPAFLRHCSVWRIPEKRKAWQHFSEQVADNIANSRNTNIPKQVSGHLKKEWKQKLDQVELFAHKLLGEEILEGAKRHLNLTDPEANRGAIALLSDRYKNLSVVGEPGKRHRKASARKRKHAG